MMREAVDRALGIDGQCPQPLVTGLSATERDSLLEGWLCFPDHPLPAGELADWAVALPYLGKVAVVMASVAAIETTLRLTLEDGADLPLVSLVLAELRVWLNSKKELTDVRRLGDLWWSRIRNQAAETPLERAALSAWLVAGYDPEGVGDPPEDSAELLLWLDEAPNNEPYVADVFSCLQQACGPDSKLALVQSVRSAVSAWRDKTTR